MAQARTVGVRIHRVVAAGVLAGEQIARRRELHLVLDARRQTGEPIDAVAYGGGGNRDGVVAGGGEQAVGAAADQRHKGAAGITELAAILLAVMVGIDPQTVAKRRKFVHARIDGGIELAGRKYHYVRQQPVAVNSGGRIRVGLPRAHRIVSGGHDELDLVIQAGRQSLELVVPVLRSRDVGVVSGRRGGKDLVSVVNISVAVQIASQLYCYAIDTGFARILNPIGVQVVPDEIADLGRERLNEERLLTWPKVEQDGELVAGIRHIAVMCSDSGFVDDGRDSAHVGSSNIGVINVPAIAQQLIDALLDITVGEVPAESGNMVIGNGNVQKGCYRP